MAVLFDLAAEINRTGHAALENGLGRQLRYLGNVLGLLQRDAHAFLQAGSQTSYKLNEAEILEKIALRQAAKQAKNYALADTIRADLLAVGVALEDRPGGATEWRRY